MRKKGSILALHHRIDSMNSLSLPLLGDATPTISLTPVPGRRALEEDSFPFEGISKIAEAESWRKEIYRPTYHIHKWWAQRLGSVFRAIVIGAFAPADADILDLFYKPIRFNDVVVFDPFMGSGTTVGEAGKIGARAIGRDINPVAHFLVKNALSSQDRATVLSTFSKIEQDISAELRQYYRTTLAGGHNVDVLYYFWVKVLDCPACNNAVDLFPSRIFARHAYLKKNTQAQSVCPMCGAINRVHNDSCEAHCNVCNGVYDPQLGSANGQKACCPSCNHTFSIAKTVRSTQNPPRHRMYAKLVLMPDGRKQYMAATDEDRSLYEEAQAALRKLENAFPVVRIEPGYNTNQVLGYNYRHWHEMFNDRQLLCLSLLANRISDIQDSAVRDLFACLFSGTLEFYNMFASYKGEGTGAVRHMFAHHILKPERVPLESNLWGTHKSSGSFSTLFASRITRALDYANDPFEVYPRGLSGENTNQKIYGLSERVGFSVSECYSTFRQGKRIYLSCGDSSKTDLPSGTVDAVITDPPFFDNVHYSQLADFFYIWQKYIANRNRLCTSTTTRNIDEVQNANGDIFTDRLTAVWSETHRVLKDDGILAFTYHHSRPEGWYAVLRALLVAGFCITAAHPVKSEMSVAMPKNQAKEPIDLDVIIVCRKRSRANPGGKCAEWWDDAKSVAKNQVKRLRESGKMLSRNDILVIVMAQVLRQLSGLGFQGHALASLKAAEEDVESLTDHLHADVKRDSCGEGEPHA